MMKLHITSNCGARNSGPQHDASAIIARQTATRSQLRLWIMPRAENHGAIGAEARKVLESHTRGGLQQSRACTACTRSPGVSKHREITEGPVTSVGASDSVSILVSW